MTGHYQAMPDYLLALERELCERAAPRRADIPAVRLRRPLFATAFAMAVLLPLLLLTGSIAPATRASGRPAVLDLPPVPYVATQTPLHFSGATIGDPGELRRIRAFGGEVDLVHVKDEWCITIPDPRLPHPTEESSGTCTTTRHFFRVGLALRVGPRFFAALPPDAEPPTLERADGTSEALQPDKLGLVMVDGLGDDETVALHGVARPVSFAIVDGANAQHATLNQQSTMNTNKRG